MTLLRIMVMVPCWMMALRSFLCTMPMRKKPSYSQAHTVLYGSPAHSRWSCGDCTMATSGLSKYGVRERSQEGRTW